MVLNVMEDLENYAAPDFEEDLEDDVEEEEEDPSFQDTGVFHTASWIGGVVKMNEFTAFYIICGIIKFLLAFVFADWVEEGRELLWYGTLCNNLAVTFTFLILFTIEKISLPIRYF